MLDVNCPHKNNTKCLHESILLTLIFKIGILTPSKYIHSAQSDNAKKIKCLFFFQKKSPSKIGDSVNGDAILIFYIYRCNYLHACT